MILNHRNMNELLKRYIPSASTGQMEQNSAQVLRRLRGETEWNVNRQVPIFSVESTRPSLKWRTRLLVPAAIALVLVAVLIIGLRSEAIAVVESVNGTLYRFDADGEQLLRGGERISADENLRAAGEAGSTVTLADQSRVEMRPKAELTLERTKAGVLVHLHKGDVIVTAAQQRNGRHLYVRTKDVTVSVIGTVFLVNAEEDGSRVAVIEGRVSVQHGTESETLSPGEQLRSNHQMPLVKVPEEVSWSTSAEQHMALLQQSTGASPTGSVSKTLVFENASVRQATGNVEPLVRCKGIDGVWPPNFRGDNEDVPLGRCIGVIGLNGLIRSLYDIRIENSNLSGIDQEPFNHLYQLNAKAADPLAATKGQLTEMLRNLIIERFKLRIHSEPRGTQTGYFLLLGKDGKQGLKIKETADAEQGSWGRPDGLPCRTPPCPVLISGNFSMKRFANHLGSLWSSNGWVVDKTGLEGIYTLNLLLNPVPQPPRPVQENPGPRGGGGGGGGSPREFNPSLATAIEEQLGLRLEYGHQIPIEQWVIDNIEIPSAN